MKWGFGALTTFPDFSDRAQREEFSMFLLFWILFFYLVVATFAWSARFAEVLVTLYLLATVLRSWPYPPEGCTTWNRAGFGCWASLPAAALVFLRSCWYPASQAETNTARIRSKRRAVGLIDVSSG
jgi:hypothetical protein